MSTKGFDVFVSYSRADRDWVRVLAGNLHEAGLHVFYDEWEIGPGDVLVHRIDGGLAGSRNGLVVVSPAALTSLWVNAEYAAMMTRAVAGRQRLIPVLLRDAEMPPLLASRVWVDFRGADGPEYERRVRELIGALRSERPVPPTPGGGLAQAPGSGVLAEGPLRRTLRIDPDQVTVLGEEESTSHRPKGMDHSDEQRLWELERARRLWPEDTLTRWTTEDQTRMDTWLQRALLDVGEALGRSFLVGDAGVALRRAVEEAESRNVPLELALELADNRIADLPWEALRVPAPDGEYDAPLALHSRVRMYRSAPGTGPVTAIQVRGPLRVLVAIGSPESDNERGELLDYEAELAAILDAVETARSVGGAQVRILERGTVAAIHQALQRERYHVLHVSCHAGPGRLVLEDDFARADLVDAGRFVSEMLPAGRGVPLVVLAGCFTANSVSDREERERGLPGLARTLLEHGVPSVLAMSALVSDVYATRLLGRVYGTLATADRPNPLAALSDVRRQIEAERGRSDRSPRHSRPEWSTPVLFQRGPRLPLYDVRDGLDEIVSVPEPAMEPEIVARRVGEFVGRRREQRLLLRDLRGERSGVIIHGLGGVGKSTLAAHLVHKLADETAMVVSISGETSADQLLQQVGRRLLGLSLERGLPENHSYRQLAAIVPDPRLDWRERLDHLQELVLSRERMILLLDNFEENLVSQPGGGAWEVRDGELGALLTILVRRFGRSRLIVTSRYPFALAEAALRRLEAYHLGPLSWAETRKLIWRLPGLDGRGRAEQRRAYADVGGHPRTLEYLDALLRGGHARFIDVAERMERALAKRGVSEPGAWMAEIAGNLDRALAETVTLAVDDVLLGELVSRLEGVERAGELLLGASVYRRPVNRAGLDWQVPDLVETEAHGPDGTLADRLRGVLEARSAAAVARLKALEDLGLVTPVDRGEGEERLYSVHRWTARALAERSPARELATAHARAASYWRWHVDAGSRGGLEEAEQLIEARHHLYAAGEIEEAVVVTSHVVRLLDALGAYGWEQRLCEETLTWARADSLEAAAFQYQLGVVAHRRGDYDAAVDWYRRSIAIFEAVGDRSYMAQVHYQMGSLAQHRGDVEKAVEYHRRSIAIYEELGDRRGIADNQHAMGAVAQQRGDHEGALEWYRRSLAVFEELGDRQSIGHSYGQLGNLAQQRGDYETAMDWYRRSLAASKELGDRVSMATTYHNMGAMAARHGDHERALDLFRRSLVIREELGDRAGVAHGYHGLGAVAELRGDDQGALGWYRRSLAISHELGSQAGVAESSGAIGVLLTRVGNAEEAILPTLRALAIRLPMRLPEVHVHLEWLGRQRSAVGEGSFWNLVRTHLDDESLNNLRHLLDQAAAMSGEDG